MYRTKKISAGETRLFPTGETASSGEKSRVSLPPVFFVLCTALSQ
ncbi:Uncharacterized protein dnm_068950 [Desulfonema magnum]|uniref:Uncharacterized protein n=1 Tax=Desulfonema magnum TaxID=45655 RepID=A0A975BSJ8_9BACT|nr:Uncharacterized protein dnm_068950 [Desulfonema magnum]